MNRIWNLIVVAVLAGCTTQANKLETGEPRNAAENRARIHTELGAAYYGAGQMPVACKLSIARTSRCANSGGVI